MTETPHRQRLLRFGLIGALTGALFYAIGYLLHSTIELSAPVASSIACIVALVFNYNGHYRWTFADRSPQGATLRRYMLMTASSVVLNAAIMYLTAVLWVWHYLLAQTLAAALMISWNLALSSLWVYR